MSSASTGISAEKSPWRALAEPRPLEKVRETGMSARAVEFIAKPGRTEELRDYICENVAPLLRRHAGFINALVLTSQEEPRRVVALTFWNCAQETDVEAQEGSALTGEIMLSAIDSCSRIRTYKVTPPAREPESGETPRASLTLL